MSDIYQITDDIKVSICYSFNYSAIHLLQGPNSPCAETLCKKLKDTHISSLD